MKQVSFIAISFLIILTSCKKWDLNRKPDVVTFGVTEISPTSALTGGKITIFPGDQFIEKGICYSRKSDPTLKDSVLKVSGEERTYTCVINNLSVNTLYYIRAYALTSFDITYGDLRSFSTLDGGHIPIFLTTTITETSQTSVRANGQITYDGGSPIKKRGFCWSITKTPTLANDTILSGSGTGLFTRILNNLYLNTTYYLRA